MNVRVINCANGLQHKKWEGDGKLFLFFSHFYVDTNEHLAWRKWQIVIVSSVKFCS